MSYKATNWAYDLRITSPMKPVLVALADMADEQASCFPGQARIAEMTGLSIATVRRALMKLEALGLISRARRGDQFGHRTSDRYQLHLSVMVTESLPLTLPTRQIAYKAESQSLPLTQSIPTAHPARGTTREPLEEPLGGAPNPFCPEHMPFGPDGKPCRKCGDAKTARRFWEQEQSSRPTPTPPRSAQDPATCVHRFIAGWCVRCEIAETAVAS